MILSSLCPPLCESTQHLQADVSQPCLVRRQMPTPCAGALSQLEAAEPC